jgi:hypothetical protein
MENLKWKRDCKCMIKEDVEEEYECMMWLSVIILSDKDNNIYGFINIYI